MTKPETITIDDVKYIRVVEYIRADSGFGFGVGSDNSSGSAITIDDVKYIRVVKYIRADSGFCFGSGNG